MQRIFVPPKGTLYAGVVLLAARLDITASTGAVATTSICNWGDSSVGTQGWVRTSAGLYTLTPKERIKGPVFIHAVLEKGTAEALWAEVGVANLDTSTQTCTFRTIVAAGTATDATNACKMHVFVYGVDSGGR